MSLEQMKNHNACRRQWADDPSPQPVLYFTWLFALSLGSFYLDPQKQDSFTLVVTVKDMAGMTMNAFTSSADVIITVKESLWKAPPTIRIQENSTQVHPVNVSQVGPLAALPAPFVDATASFSPGGTCHHCIQYQALQEDFGTSRLFFYIVTVGNDL